MYILICRSKKNESLSTEFLYFKGNRYVGEWKEDRFHGKGSFKYLNGDSYEGEWEMDKRSGKGIFISNNGEHYEGEWESDIKH